MASEIILLLVLLLLSGLFSGSEIAFVSANKLLIELKRKRSKRRGALLAKFYEKPADFMGAMLVGNNLVMVMLTALAGAMIGDALGDSVSSNEYVNLLISSLIITVVVLIFGEFIPKALFEVFAEKALFGLAYPINMARWLLSPLAWLMIRLSEKLLELITRQPTTVPDTAFTRLDLEQYIIQTHTEARDSDEEMIDANLFQNALNFNDLRVRDVMVPRNEIVGIDVNDSLPDLIELFASSNHSRLMVYEGDIDNILGYVHHQHLLKQSSSIRNLAIDLPFVPEAMRLTDLMKRFIGSRKSIAAIVDEYGSITGLITLEDIMEEIFGDISDEHDDEDEYREEQLSDNVYLLSGRHEVVYLNAKFPALRLPEGDYTTLSGYLVMTMGQIPEQGDELELGRLKFNFEEVSDTKIEMARVTVLDVAKDNED